MATPFLPRSVYIFLFSLLGIVYLAGLFVPLMDNDAAHHANIALRMYLTGDYVNLVDNGVDYLDKPHLHFWLAAWSYHLFGVTTFAYKLPSFLFTLFGIYSTYRLGKALYTAETGRLAALLIATAFAFILSTSDVRMEAILTAAIAFSTWQLVVFIQTQKLLAIVGAVLGLAVGFCTKGAIAVFVPAAGAFIYILFLKKWALLLNWKWLLLLVLFGVFISPVVYCYYLQFNLHPEKVVRGEDHINGVTFILFNQSIDRFGGKMGSDAKHDYLFFLHSFLWAFAPWSILGYIAVFKNIQGFGQRNKEWLTTGVFLTVLVVVSGSGFKLPHYLNIVFPAAAVLTAAYIIEHRENSRWNKSVFIIQSIVVLLLLLLSAFINGWAFPVKSGWVIAGLVLFLAVVFYFIKSSMYTMAQKNILVSAAAILLSFFLLNSNFYPQLLNYQGGNELAKISRVTVDAANVYFWKDTYSSSYNFYTSSLRKEFADSVLQPGKTCWILFDSKAETGIKEAGYKLGRRFETIDFEITKLNLQFIDPVKRESQCTKLVLAEISR